MVRLQRDHRGDPIADFLLAELIGVLGTVCHHMVYTASCHLASHIGGRTTNTFDHYSVEVVGADIHSI